MATKIYVGCGLTHAPIWFKVRVADLKEKLRELPDVEVLEFVGEKEATPREVYHHDINNCVAACDLMIAICDHASIGLGWEMATQVWMRKPVMAFAHRGSKITRLIQDPGLPNYQFIRYETFDQVLVKVKAELERMREAELVWG